jgi:hypothetical protein
MYVFSVLNVISIKAAGRAPRPILRGVMYPKRQMRWETRSVLVTLVVVACSDSSRPTTPPPAVPSTAAVVRLELRGPDTVHIDETEQFTVTAVRSDGSTTDVTSQVSWNFASSLLTMSTPGRLTGKAKGETAMSVATGGRSALKSVIVVPAGTYRLKGVVRDAGVIVGAQVRIENASLGTVELNAAGGEYAVFGVAGETRITVTKDGYLQESRTESIGEHRIIDIDLSLARSRPDITGTYTLRVTASGSCGTLPDDVRSRTFTASIAQNGAQLTVTLSGRDFATDRGRTLNQFRGFLEAERAIFHFSDTFGYYYFYFYTPDVLEFVSDNQYFGWDGTAALSLSQDRVAGTLDGLVMTFTGPPFRPALRCRSNQHRFEFSR